MSQFIEWIYGPERESYNNLIADAIAKSLAFEKVTAPVEVGVMIVNNVEIQGINKEQRGKDVATDVLSFPMVHYEDNEEHLNDCILKEPIHPETGEHYLGDVVISWDKVIDQSDNYGHSIERELAFLVVHSMLHLFGYDHMEKDEETVMVSKQKEILEEMGLSR